MKVCCESMKRLQNKVKFQLVGGIGNQLFIYFAGMAYSKHNNIKVNFIFDSIAKVFKGHDLDLRVFGIKSNKQVDFFGMNSIVGLLRKINNKFPKNFRSTYISSEIGYDEKFINEMKFRSFKGYFQTFRYADLFSKDFIQEKIRLEKTSPWYLSIEREIIEQRPISIHIRLGDYRKYQNIYGLLNYEYFDSAIRLIFEKIGERAIWVFSNEIENLNSYPFRKNFKNVEFIDPPKDSNPAESLILMSKSDGLVISNSTFSWWSAYLGNQNKIVVAPSRWFISKENPKFLYPNNWLLNESTWF